MMIPKGVTLPEYRAALVAYRSEYGKTPAPEELVAFIAIKETQDAERFVRVVFHGNTTRYTYEVDARCDIGDYVQVWSPMTQRHEIVRVVELGRGGWTLPTKRAKRVAAVILDVSGAAVAIERLPEEIPF